jgi:hypothetical protein
MCHVIRVYILADAASICAVFVFRLLSESISNCLLTVAWSVRCVDAAPTSENSLFSLKELLSVIYRFINVRRNFFRAREQSYGASWRLIISHKEQSRPGGSVRNSSHLVGQDCRCIQLLTAWSWAHLKEAANCAVTQEQKVLLPCLQEHTIGPYPEPDRSSPSYLSAM